MAPHSSTLARKIPWTEEPGRLQSMGLRRVGHDWATSLSLFTFLHWRRKWQPTPVFLPGEFHGQRSLAGYSPWGHKELDVTEQLSLHFTSPLLELGNKVTQSLCFLPTSVFLRTDSILDLLQTLTFFFYSSKKFLSSACLSRGSFRGR